ncbi:MMPL family transporter [Mumia sp. DW29H23]|uniref:MMPL family transporter n=1 Tax=Mumia sp. DW29H23 TaxID=3421241 RepID=UPI003D6812F1
MNPTTDTTDSHSASRQDGPVPARATRPGPLGRLARVCFRRRGTVLIAWFLALCAAVGLSSAFGGEFVNGTSLPGSDSEKAQSLLADRFPAQAGDRIDVVVRADDVTSPEVRAEVGALVAQLESVPHVAEVENPYASADALAQAVSPDDQVLVARLYLDVANPNDMPVEDTERLLAAADAVDGGTIDVALSGDAVRAAETPMSNAEAVGLIAAAVVLLIVFGSLVAAGLPLVMAIASLAVSASLVGLAAAVVDVPEFATTIAAMLGIAVGIDYALLMVTRFREWRAAGLDPEAATAAALDTAGRAVLVAGATVMISMLGLFAMGLSIMDGTALVAMLAVLVVVVAAATLFPALLGYTGRWVDRLRLPLGRRRRGAAVGADGHLAPSAAWVRWSRLVERHGVLATVGAVAVLIVLALPFLGVSFAMPDASNDAKDTSNRQAYDTLASGFGPGYNGPLLVVADLAKGADGVVLDRLQEGLASTPDVAAVSPARVSPDGDTALFTVVPTTGPQDATTEDLVHAVRDEVIPVATQGSGATAHVGGRTATSIDLNASLVDRLPYLVGGVVLVSMVLLTVAFRSVVIPVTAAVMNLLSVAAAYGVLAYFLEGGWAGGLVGIDEPAPLAGYIPVIMFALLFGLSMDYEVFLISRMSETWSRTRDNRQAVLSGLAGTGRVITAAASIMIVVFAMLLGMDGLVFTCFGVGMVAAILIDATIVRMLLVPAVMLLLGERNWWLPRMLARLPQLHVEGRADAYLPPVASPAGASR